MVSFLREVRTSFPDGVSLPEEFAALLAWMEADGFVRRHRNNDRRYASLYPQALEGEGSSDVFIHPVDPGFAKAWTRSGDRAVCSRLAAFVRTGGDGSHAAIWRNDEGGRSFVHLGSGSGSTMLCTLTDDPVEFLRLLAMGYEELCWPDQYALTPEKAYEEGHDGDEPYLPPLHFRSWVATTFDVTIPKKASEIVARTVNMDARTSDDPFWRWIGELRK